MEILEQISEFFEELFKVFISKPVKIISLSVTIFLAIPIIKWFISSIIYIIKPTSENLDNFIFTTFIDNVIPWYIGILIEPIKSLFLFLLIILLVTIGFYVKENS